MSIFGSIMDKIFHAGTEIEQAGGGCKTGRRASASAPPAASSPAQPAAPAPAPALAPAQPTPAPAGTAQPVDVEAVLTAIAAKKGGGGNWQSSIVDLLKLLDLDSSLDARKELAQELNVHAGADGSPEENIALHKAVMPKLADNGGKVPDSLKA